MSVAVAIDSSRGSGAGLDLTEVNERLAGKSAEDIVAWAAANFGPPLMTTSSFGAYSAVMLHLVATHAPGTPVVFLDTGHLFPETYRFARDLVERLDLDLRVYTPRMTPAHQEALFGRKWEQGDEGVRDYLQVNKVEPMHRALRELQPSAWFAGLRAGQTEHRASLRTVDVQDDVYKVHPILEWTQGDVEAYLECHDLPVHPLVAKGYRSIGDVHSTMPTLPGQDPREGRMLGKTRECGIHVGLTADENRSLTSSKL